MYGENDVASDVWGLWFNRIAESRAREHQGLAEVYERFATRLIGEIAGDLMLAEFEKLTGPAELNIGRPAWNDLAVELAPIPSMWQQNYWRYYWTIGRIADPSSLIITATN
jgi:hypothetical protein